MTVYKFIVNILLAPQKRLIGGRLLAVLGLRIAGILLPIISLSEAHCKDRKNRQEYKLPPVKSLLDNKATSNVNTPKIHLANTDFNPADFQQAIKVETSKEQSFAAREQELLQKEQFLKQKELELAQKELELAELEQRLGKLRNEIEARGGEVSQKVSDTVSDKQSTPNFGKALYPPPSVVAKSALVFDAKSGDIFHEKNADLETPIASTQKLLTALLALEAGELKDEIRIQSSDTRAQPSRLGFKAGEVYTRGQLIEVLLVKSANDVALALARDSYGNVTRFVQMMNKRAMDIGMKRTFFVNPNGLPAPGQSSTARDLYKLALLAYKNPVIREITRKKTLKFRYANGRVVNFRNTNKLLNSMSSCNGLKTGYTRASGYCLVASGAKQAGDKLRERIVIVLKSSSKWVFKDAKVLLEWALSF